MISRNSIIAFVVVLAVALSARAADTVITLSDVHMCCGQCVNGVPAALKDMANVKGVGNQEKRTIEVTAPDKETAQKAVNALIAAGYFGKSSDATIKAEAPAAPADAKVQAVEVTGVHLCCGRCVTTVKELLTKIDGVKANTVVQRAPSFTVTGDFNAKTIAEELNKAGLAGKVVATPAKP